MGDIVIISIFIATLTCMAALTSYVLFDAIPWMHRRIRELKADAEEGEELLDD